MGYGVDLDRHKLHSSLGRGFNNNHIERLQDGFDGYARVCIVGTLQKAFECQAGKIGLGVGNHGMNSVL